MSKRLDYDSLLSVFYSGCKAKDKWKVGTEHEKFGFNSNNLHPISFEDINEIFDLLSIKYKWEKIFENNLVISLKKNGASITLEPGGQLELSGAPFTSLFETCNEVNTHKEELNDVCKLLDISFMGIGVLPKWDLEKIPIMPKRRYEIMSKYMPKVGRHGLDMMKRTTTIQANFDFSSTEDMKIKMRVAQSLQPCIIALYANSPFIDGKLTEYQSYRSYIWTKTDKNRTGLLEFIYSKDFCFEDYTEYLLDVPMYFIVRNKKYIDLTGLTFRDYMEDSTGKFEPSMDDWNNHITTVFPEVRLKSYIEVRGADGGPWSRVCALPAFWTGILYDEEILNRVWDLAKNWKFDEIENFYDQARLNGLDAVAPNGESIKTFLKKILNYSSIGLKNRNIVKKGYDESMFLKPLFEILESGQSPAKFWVNQFVNDWSRDIDMLYKNNYF